MMMAMEKNYLMKLNLELLLKLVMKCKIKIV
ncbi:uncharacterized protein METZ01_LOCUS414759 [marine metagenome]|uniref:Uncharacterized protein n=1 Tax=marine metagenome TaxID=408172 RepID=A0A382WU24_9ZZZZ